MFLMPLAMSNVSYSNKHGSELSADEDSWHDKQWDKQDRLYMGEDLVNNWGFQHNFKQYFFAHQDEKLVGILELRITNGVGMIYSLIVDPDFRNKGIGKQLLRDCIGFSRAKGLFHLWLESRTEWEAAVILYASEGFEVLATMPVYYFGVEWIRMGKTL